MFALKSRTGRDGRRGDARRPRLSLSVDRFVLPRSLRRPVRFVAQPVRAASIALPRYAGAVATAVFCPSTRLYGAWIGGQMPAVAQAVTARIGFAVDQVRVSGNSETSEIDILERLDLDGWTSLVGFDAEAARERIAALPWVKVASVRKIYPDALEVRIEERKPFAIWQHGSELCARSSATGNVIAPFDGSRLRDAAAGHRLRRAASGADVRRQDRGAIPSSQRGSRATSASPSGAGTCASTTASRSGCPRTARTRRSPSSRSSTARTGCCRATSPPSTCGSTTGWSSG